MYKMNRRHKRDLDFKFQTDYRKLEPYRDYRELRYMKEVTASETPSHKSKLGDVYSTNDDFPSRKNSYYEEKGKFDKFRF